MLGSAVFSPVTLVTLSEGISFEFLSGELSLLTSPIVARILPTKSNDSTLDVKFNMAAGDAEHCEVSHSQKTHLW